MLGNFENTSRSLNKEAEQFTKLQNAYDRLISKFDDRMI